MIRSLWISASGLQTQQMNIDTIGNNVSNINTTGFKKSDCEFHDLIYGATNRIGAFLPEGQQSEEGRQIGCGVGLMATRQAFNQGNLEDTGNYLDLGINGKGFFKVSLTDGNYAYTRDGSLTIDGENGRLTTSTGYYLEPSATIPSGATSISVSEDGVVSAILEGEDEPQEIGRIDLFKFTNPDGLQKVGENLFVETAASGVAAQGNPGVDGLGMIKQGFLEASNVELADEMTNMIMAQRAYQMNARAIKNADMMLSIANQILRG